LKGDFQIYPPTAPSSCPPSRGLGLGFGAPRSLTFCGREKLCICCGAKMNTAQEKRREEKRGERVFCVIFHSWYFFIECVFSCLFVCCNSMKREVDTLFFAFKMLQTS
jgi:hypothetical protein